MSIRGKFIGLVLIAAISPLAFCADLLKPGDPAPSIKVDQWLKGDGVSKLSEGKVYVVGFFASWNMLCQRSIPQWSTLQTKYKDQVVFIGVDTWEKSPDDLDAFLKQNGDTIKFSFGADKPENNAKEGPMTTQWLRAAKKSTLPTAFIIGKDGAIAWIGDSLSIERPLAQVVAGKYDSQKESELKNTLSEFKTSQQQALSEKNYDQAIEIAGKIIQTDGTQALTQGIVILKAMGSKGDSSGASAVGNKLMERYASDAASLRTLAWAIIKDESGKIDPKLALSIAQKIQNNSDAWADRHLLAQAYFACADFKRAVDCQTQVVDAVEDPAMKQYQNGVLLQYKVAAGM